MFQYLYKCTEFQSRRLDVLKNTSPRYSFKESFKPYNLVGFFSYKIKHDYFRLIIVYHKHNSFFLYVIDLRMNHAIETIMVIVEPTVLIEWHVNVLHCYENKISKSLPTFIHSTRKKKTRINKILLFPTSRINDFKPYYLFENFCTPT
jgi:hypothetical protein